MNIELEEVREIGQKIKSACSGCVAAWILSTISDEELEIFREYLNRVAAEGPLIHPTFFAREQGFSMVAAVKARLEFVETLRTFVAEDVRANVDINEGMEGP